MHSRSSNNLVKIIIQPDIIQGIGVVLPLENQMRTPHEMRGWNGVLNTSMILVSCLYIAVGFFGYLKYGDQVAGSITLNLPVDEL